MLVNNGDLPKPEQNVLSQQLNSHSQMVPKGALNVSNVQSPSSSSSTKDSNQQKHQQQRQQQQQQQSRIDHHNHSELNELLTIEDMKECITGVISSSRRAAYNNKSNQNNSNNITHNSNNAIINSNNNINSNQSNNNSNNNNNNSGIVSVKREFDADSNIYFNPDFKEGDDEVDDDDYLLDPSLEQIAKRFKY
jgi:hypothetical protein